MGWGQVNGGSEGSGNIRAKTTNGCGAISVLLCFLGSGGNKGGAEFNGGGTKDGGCSDGGGG